MEIVWRAVPSESLDSVWLSVAVRRSTLQRGHTALCVYDAVWDQFDMDVEGVHSRRITKVISIYRYH